MPYVRDSFWRGREFTSLAADAGRGAWPGAARWPGSGRAGRWTGPRRRRCSPRSRPQALQPLPVRPFVLATWSTRDGRPGHPRQGRQDALLGAVAAHRPARRRPGDLDHGPVLPQRTAGRHPRPQADTGKRTDLSHYPPEKIAFRMRTPTWCRTRAAEIGPACAAVIADLLEVNALFRLRAAQGVLGLADKHGADAAGGRLRQGDRGRRPVLPHHQGHPRRRRRDRPAATGRPATAAPPRTCTARRSCSRTSSPCPPRTPTGTDPAATSGDHDGHGDARARPRRRRGRGLMTDHARPPTRSRGPTRGDDARFCLRPGPRRRRRPAPPRLPAAAPPAPT